MVEILFRLFFFFLPSLISYARGQPKTFQLTLLNAVIGWNSFGWCLLFTSALTDPEDWTELSEYKNKLLKQFKAIFTCSKNTLDQIEAKTKSELEELSGKISNYELHYLVVQALDQLKLLANHRKDFHEALKRKLNKGELTFNRYQAALDALIEVIVSNLSIAVSILSNLEDSDLFHVLKYLYALKDSNSSSKAEWQTCRTLLERSELFTQQAAQVSEILSSNEVALTQLEKLLASLAALNLVSGRNPPSFEETVEELEQLTEQVNLYQRNSVPATA